jgi:cyanophycin synthetase
VILSVRAFTQFAGPSIWCRQPVSHVAIGTTIRGSRDQEPIPALAVRAKLHLLDLPLLSRVSPLPILEPAVTESLADVIAMVALNLQRLAGSPVAFTCTETRPEDGDFTVVVEYQDPIIGRHACTLAVHLIDGLLQGTDSRSNFADEWRRFNTLASTRLPDLPASAIIRAAAHRSIPVQVDDPRARFIDLGNGAFRQRILGSITAATSAVAERIARDKGLTNLYLRSAGLPVPDGLIVRSMARAAKAATALGYPVVVKPVDGGSSAGVFVNVQDQKHVEEVFPKALEASISRTLLIERFIPGDRYRAVIVDGRLNSVVQHLKAFVTGDGERSITQLIERANADPRRGARDSNPLVPISIDSALLQHIEEQGFSLGAVPSMGQHVELKPMARRGEGSYSIDRTDHIHPSNAAILEQASRAIGLDIATIDLVTHDISRSMWTDGGAIVDVNTGSGFNSELHPAEGQPRDPGPAIIDMLFPPGRPVRVPIVAVTGAGDRTSLVHEIAGIMSAAGFSVGVAAADELFVNGTHLRGVDPGAGAARKILNHPAVELAVIEVDPFDILEYGLCFDYCDVAVVLSASEGAPEGIALPEAVVCRIVAPGGTVVLDAADPHAAELMGAAGGEVILTGEDPDDRFAAIEHALRSLAG